jgi:hypothetical protein
MADKDFVVKNGLVTGTNNVTIGNSVYIVANGNVGVGTATPNALVTIVGPTTNATNLNINGLTVTYNSNTFNNSSNVGGAAIGGYNANGFGVLGRSGPGIGVIGVANVGGGYGVGGYAHSTADSFSVAGYFLNQSNGIGVRAASVSGRPFVVANATVDIMTVISNGNIGIGDSTPAVRLVVNGSINATSINAASYTVGTSTIANATGVYTGVVNAASHTVGTSTIANATGVYTGTINAASHTVGTSFTANSTLVNAVSLVVSTNTSIFGTAARIVANGNIGVGTATPGEKITVISTDSTGAAGFQTLSGTATALGAAANAGIGAYIQSRTGRPLVVANNTTEFFQVVANGNIGIGTATPNSLVTIVGPTANATNLDINGLTVTYNSNTFTSSSNVGGAAIGGYNANGFAILGRSSAGIGIVGVANSGSGIAIAGYAHATTNSSAHAGFFVNQSNGIGVRAASVVGRSFVASNATVEFMSVEANGNIGFSNSSPRTRLHITRSSGAASAGEIYLDEGLYWSMLNSRSTVGAWNSLVQTNDHTLIYSDGSADTGALVIGPWSSDNKGMRIASNGNIGIGTATPGERITVISTDGRGAGFFLSNTGNGLSSKTENGFAGIIGVSNSGSTSVAIAGYANTGYGGYFQTFFGTQTALAAVANAGVAVYAQSGTGRPLVVANNTVEFMTIVANGNIGIGTATPNSLLTIAGPSGNATNLDINGLTVTYNSNTFTSSSNVGGAAIGGYNANGFGVLGRTSLGIGVVGAVVNGGGIAVGGYAQPGTNSSAFAGYFINQSNGVGLRAISVSGRPFVAANNTTEIMSVEANGNVIINSAVFATHHNITSLGGVFRTGAGDYGVRIYPGGGSDSNTAILQFTNAAQNTQTAQIAVNTAGLFIGTSVSTGVYLTVGGVAKASLDASGNFVANGNITAFGSVSDERLKENITPFSNTLDKVKRLQGVTYNWKKGTAERDFAGINNDIGLIAQNVQEVFPDLVREGEDGYLSLRDRGLFAILIEAIKEQQNQIDELKKMLENK